MQPPERDARTPYEILGGDARVRDQWMACMVRAMKEVGVPQGLRMGLEQSLFKTADWMRNRPG